MRVLPRGPGREAAVRLARLRRGRGGRRRGGRSGVRAGQAGRVRAAARRRRSPIRRVAERAADDTAVILYTSRHHRQAEGRRAHAREPARATAAPPRARSAELARGRRAARRAAAVPLLRADLHDELRAWPPGPRSRCCRASIRRRRWRSSSRDRVTIFQGVPTMYNAMLHAEAADDRGHLHAAALHVRRRGDAGRADARLRGEVRLHHPRGLRALGDLPGRLLQPPGPRAQAGLDRHADRRASR